VSSIVLSTCDKAAVITAATGSDKALRVSVFISACIILREGW
jgi:hypothetical protein